MIKESVNTFNEGVNYDLNPIVTPKNMLTDCVNGTFITFNGDELALQNDAGNTIIKGKDQINIIENTETKYGLLYNWYTITDSRKIMSSDDWFFLSNSQNGSFISYLGTNGADKVKSTRQSPDPHPRWDASPEMAYATNSLGLSLLPAGMRRSGGDFIEQGYATYIWSSTGWTYSGNDYANDILALSDYRQVITDSTFAYVGKTLRPARLATELELSQDDGTLCANYIGNDDKIYTTVKIGTYVWLTINLCETKFRNKEWITGFDGGIYTPIDDTTWDNATKAMVCAYNDDLESNAFTTTIEEEIIETPVKLSPGFYPLGMKEYGGILYIVSGKNPEIEPVEFNDAEVYSKGDVVYTKILDVDYYYESLRNSNNSTLPISSDSSWLYIGTYKDFINRYGFVEFGSYPSPERLDAGKFDASVDYKVENALDTYPNEFKFELYNPKIINDSIFQAGVYVKFFQLANTTLNTDYISYRAYTNLNSEAYPIYDPKASQRKIYKVKLYHQLSNGFIDLTLDVWRKYARFVQLNYDEELNSVGTIRFWFNDPNFKYYCPHNYKGKLAISIELEELEEFSLDPLILTSDGTNYTITFPINWFSGAGWTNSPITNYMYICYTTDGSEPIFNINTTTNFQSILTPFPPASNHPQLQFLMSENKGKLLKYKLRPLFSVEASSFWPMETYFPQKFIDMHTITGSRLILSEFDDYVITADSDTTVCEVGETGYKITNLLVLENSAGQYLNNELQINPDKFYFYYQNGTAPTNWLGKYTFGTDGRAMVTGYNSLLPLSSQSYITGLVQNTIVRTYDPVCLAMPRVKLTVVTNREFTLSIPIKVQQMSGLAPGIKVGTNTYEFEVVSGQSFTIVPTAIGTDQLYTYTGNISVNTGILFGLVTKLTIAAVAFPLDQIYSDRFYINMGSATFGASINSDRFTIEHNNISEYSGPITPQAITAGQSLEVYDYIWNGHTRPLYDIHFLNTGMNNYVNLTGIDIAVEGANHIFLKDYLGLTQTNL